MSLVSNFLHRMCVTEKHEFTFASHSPQASSTLTAMASASASILNMYIDEGSLSLLGLLGGLLGFRVLSFRVYG